MAIARLNLSTLRVLPVADLYYLHSYLQFPAIWWRSKRCGAPFIYDAHDFYAALPHDGRTWKLGDRLVQRLLNRTERLCASRASACVTVSNGVAAMCEARFGRPFSVVRNAHDARLDKASTRSLRSELGLSSDACLMVVVGNEKPRGMAVHEAISALSRLPSSVHLTFIGAGYDEAGSWAASLGVAERVHVIPPVPPPEVRSLIASCDLAPILYWDATPNLHYALPNGLFHAVAAEIPLLYPDLPEVRALADEYALGLLIDPRSPESIAQAVQALREAPGLYATVSAGVARAADHLTWEAEEPQLESVISACLGLA